MRVLCLVLMMSAPAAFAAEFDADTYYANAGAVTGLCRAVMTPADASAEVTRQFEGLCDCAMSGIMALNTKAANAPFLAVWADIARWRAANDPSDLDAVYARADAAIYTHYRDMKAGKAEMQRYGDIAITLTQICSHGYASSGLEPPDFSAAAFYDGFPRKPD